jgi:hypothetical protein
VATPAAPSVRAAEAGAPKRGSIEAKIAAKEAEIERRVGAVSLANEARARTGSRIQSTRESRANAALSQARRELHTLKEQQRQQAAPARDYAAEARLQAAADREEGDRQLRMQRLIDESRQGTVRAAAPAAPRAVDAISRHVSAPVSIDIFENGAGQIDIGNTIYDLRRDRDSGKWHADHLEGPAVAGKGMSADTVANLARKLADAHGVSGAVSIQDERDKGKSLTQRFEHKAAKPRAQRVEEALQRDREARAGDFGTPNRRESYANLQTPPNLQQPFNARVANGGGAAPRIEGETDFVYGIRTAPSADAAERLLNGYSLAGLRAAVRESGGSIRAGALKKELVQYFLDRRQRYYDSQALSKR